MYIDKLYIGDLYNDNDQSISILDTDYNNDGIVFPVCCVDEDGELEEDPEDTCPNNAGLDPNNNVMAYIPDWCAYEFTPGQMARMIAQVKAEKDISKFLCYLSCPYIYIVNAADSNSSHTLIDENSLL